MKEYKVVKPKLGLGNWNEKMEDLLNKYAREGWVLKHVGPNYSMVIIERDKNR